MRRNRTAKTTNATVPRIAIRNASCGVRRYGSSTRGSPGRKRILGKELNLGVLDSRLRPEEPPADEVDRPGHEQVQPDPLEERVEQDRPRGRRLAEDVTEQKLADPVEERRDGDREVGRVRAV